MNRKSFTIDFGLKPKPFEPPIKSGPDFRGIDPSKIHYPTPEERRERALKESDRPKRGRQVVHYSKRRKPVTISLSPVEKREIETVGGGSLTGGVKHLLKCYREQIIEVRINKPKKHRIDPPKSHLTKIDPETGHRLDGTLLSRNLQRRTPIHPPILDRMSEDEE